MRILMAWVFTFFISTAQAEPVDYSLPDLNGNTVSLADYKGKWVIVNYWATWCPPCQDEIPDLVDFHERHHDKDAVVIGINTEDIGLEQLTSFAESFLINYPVLRSDAVMKTPLGDIPGLPTTYIVAPDGSPVARQVGPVTSEQLEQYISRKQAELGKP
jgi:thiol-disulfide isomerase/thioredoxin